METTNKERKYENFHIVLWLLKDLCWVAGLTVLGTIMIIPTIGMAIYISWLTRNSRVDIFHNLAVVCWITANSIWMMGEMYFDETDMQFMYEYSRMAAFCLFFSGIGFISWYHVEKRLLRR